MTAQPITSMTTDDLQQHMGPAVRQAANTLALADSAAKNLFLQATATALEAQAALLLEANALDVSAARDQPAAFQERLALNEARIAGMVKGLHAVANLPDPVGQMRELTRQPSGITVGRMRVPLGVLAMVFESRPNVAIEAAALAVKAGNAIYLKAGAEALHTCRVLDDCIQKGLCQAGLPPEAVVMLPNNGRHLIQELIRSTQWIDLLIARGSHALLTALHQESRVPIMGHLSGNCHIYVDDRADLGRAMDIVCNAKLSRPGVCNATETLLVAEAIATSWLPAMLERLREAGCTIRGCPATRALVPWVQPATEQDWDEEYLAPILAVRVLAGLDEAMAHIACHGTQHTEVILTEDLTRTQRFLRGVDASSVVVNASSRFADGSEYGLGAEIGIATGKLHARGPVALEGLTCEKWIVLGQGQVRG